MNENDFALHGTARGDAASFPIAVGDQASRCILLFDPDADNWNRKEALLWSYQVPPAMVQLLNDMKLRNHPKLGGQWMVVCTSGSAAIISYPEGKLERLVQVEGSNAHSVELLPDGQLAIATSTAGWVRVYGSSQEADSSYYAEYPLVSAHGVQWDPQRNVLWALGFEELVALEVAGTSARPELIETMKVALPTRNGHDLQPVIGDRDRLWITSGSQVYQYIKSTNTFDSGYADRESISLSGVKSVGNQPSGRVILTRPKQGSLYSWTTDTVTLASPADVRVIEGVAMYKARIWNSDYN
jgi:hypothetical protein